MSVIAHLRIPAASFELGRIFELQHGSTIELETLVPAGETAVPFVSVHESVRETFEESVRGHPSVDELRLVSQHNSQTLYAFEWRVSRDLFFDGISKVNAHVLKATGTANTWQFEIRFPDHHSLSVFYEHCSSAHIPLEVGRIYNPTRPGSGPWYGLTDTQRDTLTRAVEGGYYSIPRRMSTQDLAEEFDISDQAVTERLRRAIITLVENALVSAMEDEEFKPVQ